MTTNTKPIYALTILEPWATLIALGAKHFETRGWSTDYRGDLVIHAGKNSDYIMPALSSPTFAPVLKAAGYQSDADFHLGCALCVVHLQECWPVQDLWRRLMPQERAFGDFDLGRYGWELRNRRPFAKPVPARGAQGLWKWTGPLPEGVDS